MEANTVSALTEFLGNFLLGVWSCVSITFLVSMIQNIVNDRKREKRNAAWEAERQQLEKERALREVEYHEARMKELDKS